jgi:hypothetical protein
MLKHILKAVFRFFDSFRARLVSRVANCANKTKKIGHWCQKTYPLEKLQKLFEKVTENFCTQFKTKNLPNFLTIMIKLFSCEFFANFFNGFTISPDSCVFDGMAEKLNFFKEFVACKKNVTDYCKSVYVCPCMGGVKARRKIRHRAGGKAGREGVFTV